MSAVVTVVAVVAGMGVWGMLVGMFALGTVTTAGQMYASRKLTGSSRCGGRSMGPRRGRSCSPGWPQASLQGSLMVEPAMAKAILSALDGPESAAAMQLGFTLTRLALVAAMAPTATILVGVSGGATASPSASAGWSATPPTPRWRWPWCWPR